MVQHAAYLSYLLLVGLSARVVWDTRASYREKVVATFAARMALPVPPEVGSVVLARLVTRARAGAEGGVSAIVVFAVLIEFFATEDVQTMLAWLLPAVVFLGVSAGWAVTAISSTLSRPAREVRIARPHSRRWAGEDPAAAILSNGWAGLMIWGLIAICLYVMVAHPQQRFHATLWAAADPAKSGTGAP